MALLFYNMYIRDRVVIFEQLILDNLCDNYLLKLK